MNYITLILCVLLGKHSEFDRSSHVILTIWCIVQVNQTFNEGGDGQNRGTLMPLRLFLEGKDIETQCVGGTKVHLWYKVLWHSSWKDRMKLDFERDEWLLEVESGNSLSLSCCKNTHFNFESIFSWKKLHPLLFKTLQLVEFLFECGSSWGFYICVICVIL